MARRLLSVALLLLAPAVRAGEARVPLDPATLGGADIFTAAETHVAEAATAAGLAFAPDPRPLPPQIVVTLDTPDGAVEKRGGILFWRGDMLPDQLAPGETGTLVRKRRTADGSLRTSRVREAFGFGSDTHLAPTARAGARLALPAMIIETAYRLGTVADATATLVLWRSVEEDTAPLGGYIALPDSPPGWLEALQARLPPFATRADWAAEFDARAP